MPRIGLRDSVFRYLVKPELGCVISACPIASSIGARVLRNGGNAIDAAVATGLCLAVTYPQAGNLGGGGFMLVHSADGEARYLDYRETAPLLVHSGLFIDGAGNTTGSSLLGGLAVGVPGTIAGLAEAAARHGRLGWDRLVAGAIDVAENGYWITNRQATYLNIYKDDLGRFETTRAWFLPNGKPLEVGTLFKQPDLANCLRILAADGPSAFYSGRIAERILHSTTAHGGVLSAEDLAGYRPQWRKPLRVRVWDRDIYASGPPSGGGAVLGLALRCLEAEGVEQTRPGSIERCRLLARAFRAAFAVRFRSVCDPDFAEDDKALHHLLLNQDSWDGTLSELERGFGLIDEIGEPGPSLPERCTTHFVVMDGEGNTVSNTYTLNTLFGNKLIVDKCGFFLNNCMDDFCIAPNATNWYRIVESRLNLIVPGKRPPSSMTPTIVCGEGGVELALGAGGGPRIPTAVAQVIVGVLVDGLRVRDAVSAPRVHHQLMPNEVQVETILPAGVVAELEKWQPVASFPRLGIVCAVHKDANGHEIHAIQDPRF